MTLTGVTQSKIGDVYLILLASERSERDSIMQNRVYVICIYVCGMVRMPLKRARGERFSPKKTRLFKLDPSLF